MPQGKTIGDVARILHVSPSLLRYWERQKLVTPTRTASGYRLYSADMIRSLKRIVYLRRTKGVNSAGILQLRGRDTELPSVPEPQVSDIGKQLMGLRQQIGITRAEAAARAGLRPPTVDSLERGLTKPSIATIQKLTQAYRTTVLSLFNQQARNQQLVRPRDRAILVETGIRMELLAFGALQMQVMLFRVAPKASSGGSYRHEGEEFIYMLNGKFEIWLDEVEHYLLGAGDSLYFLSTRTHRWRAVGDEEAVLLWINSPPTF